MTNQKFCPAISIVIPLYNAEKYIGECLESLLAQTFKDFEVIIVDDASTDNSVAVVKSYAPKFYGRLILSSMEENMGSGALPRNKGMALAHGDYITFVDNDDLITPTALEELYTLAKDYDADVVYCEKHYRINEDGTGLRITTDAERNVELISKPTFESEDLTERVKKILRAEYRAPQWRKFVRRHFIFKHELFFPNTRHADDTIWTNGLVFYAKKFLRVPNAVYLHRQTSSSIMHKERLLSQAINFWLNPVLFGLKCLDNFMSRHEFFRQNPQYRYAVLENFLLIEFSGVLQISNQLSPTELYGILRQEFSKNFGEQDVVIAALCTVLNSQQKNLRINLQQFNEFVAQTQKRIADLEKINRENKAYIAELEKFIIGLNRKDG